MGWAFIPLFGRIHPKPDLNGIVLGRLSEPMTGTVLLRSYQFCLDHLPRYSIGTFLSIPEKVYLATRILLPPSDDTHPLNITYLSAATFPLALPPTVAKGWGIGGWFGFEGVNSRFGQWVLGLLTSENDERRYSPPIVAQTKSFASGNGDTASISASLFADTAETVHGWTSEEPRLRGWTFLDFFQEPQSGLVPLLVECNWRGRKSGQEGWP